MLYAASDRRNDISRHGGGDRRLQAVAGPDVRQTPGPPRPSRAGAARLASLIAKRKAALAGRGPVLVLDAGDYSMGTEFATSTRETGGELKLMSRVGYDATTYTFQKLPRLLDLVPLRFLAGVRPVAPVAPGPGGTPGPG